MQTIAVASRKGGSGKTTMASELCVEAARQGVGRVCFVDLDPMLGLTKWWEAREAETPERLEVHVGGLMDALPELNQRGYALLIIDTPPAAGPVVAEAIRVADLVLVPVQPSPHDLRAIPETIGLVEQLGKPMVFVINGARKRAVLTGEAAKLLSQHGTVATPSIHRAEAFPQAAVTGETVFEREPSSGPAAEIRALWQYLAGRLARQQGSTLTVTPSAQPRRKTAVRVTGN